MPTGEEIVKSFLKFVHFHYNLNITDFNDSLDNGFASIDNAILILKSDTRVPSRIIQLLDCYSESNLDAHFLTDPFRVSSRIEILDFASPEFSKRNRSFCLSDAEFGYLSSKKMFSNPALVDIVNDEEGYRALVDFTGSAVMQSPPKQLLIEFLNIIITNDNAKGFLVHKINHPQNAISVYSYLYLQKLMQGGRLSIDPALAYTGSHGASAIFSNGIIYQQYFELCDIVNEINHSSEMITRFLKVYHLLEYLVYRVELVKVEQKARINRTFIREIHGLTGKKSENEQQLFKKNFAVLFQAEISSSYFSFGTLTPAQTIFLNDYLSISTYNPRDASHVTSLIYGIRNSIVHNKESEFHMTTTNPEAYNDIIPLMQTLIEKLERGVFDKISNNLPSISYQSSSIQLY